MSNLFMQEFETLGAEKPAARSTYAQVAVGNDIYIFGGYTGSANLDDFWKLNVLTNTWTKITTATKPSARRAVKKMIYSTINNSIYLVGGRTTTEVNDVWEYNIELNTWTQKVNCPKALDGYQAYYYNNEIYILCGRNADIAQKTSYKYNITNNVWSELADCPIAIMWGMSVLKDDKVYIWGGNTSQNVFIYNIASNTWEEKVVNSNKSIIIHHNSTAFLDGNNMVIIDGTDSSYTTGLKLITKINLETLKITQFNIEFNILNINPCVINDYAYSIFSTQNISHTGARWPSFKINLDNKIKKAKLGTKVLITGEEGKIYGESSSDIIYGNISNVKSVAGKMNKALRLTNQQSLSNSLKIINGLKDIDYSKGITIDWWEKSNGQHVDNSALFETKGLILSYNKSAIYARSTDISTWDILGQTPMGKAVEHGKWTHIAIIIKNLSIEVYQDGVKKSTTAISKYPYYEKDFDLGNYYDNPTYSGYNADIENFRISDKVLWTENFVPPIMEGDYFTNMINIKDVVFSNTEVFNEPNFNISLIPEVYEVVDGSNIYSNGLIEVKINGAIAVTDVATVLNNKASVNISSSYLTQEINELNIRLYNESKDTYKDEIYSINKISRDTFTITKKFYRSSNYVKDGDILFNIGTGLSINGAGIGTVAVNIPTDGKDKIKNVIVNSSADVSKEISNSQLMTFVADENGGKTYETTLDLSKEIIGIDIE